MSQPMVTIEQGTLRGSPGTDIKGNTFLKFQGIPYAKPPLGNLRFKAPQPPEKWLGILDATKEGEVCIHRDALKNWEIVKGGEDCLVLNVFTKKLSRDGTGLKPVLFWIHGGGLIFGSGCEELYGPDFLMTEDVVLVTINYRLGVLGFINFEEPSLDIPGNAGFKDQVMALRWVQKNISKFGGDPNNVTIFGESAGGASVHLLVLSPMAKGLFHRAIAQSGCALNPWASGTRGSKTLAKALGLEGADEKTIHQALLAKTTEEIVAIQDKMGDSFDANNHRDLGLVLERNSKEPFLSEEPIDVILAGKFNHVPFMIGYTSSEGMCFEVIKLPNAPDTIDFGTTVPWSFGYEAGSKEAKAVADRIKKFYLGNEEYSSKLFSKKIDVWSDCQFFYGIYVTVMSQFLVSKAPTYFYKMTVETNLNFFKNLAKIQFPGVSHCDDIGYLFKNFTTPEIQPGSVEEISLTRFVKLWTNFAKFGNPTPDADDDVLEVEWKPVTGPNVDYLDIGEELTMRSNPDPERIKFWKSLFVESPVGQKTECPYLRK